MTTLPQTRGAEDRDAPLMTFSNCHAGILSHLISLDELPALLEPATRARHLAEATTQFFHDAVFEHHSEEERELFPAVLASALQGEELERVQWMVKKLTREHRQIEAMWSALAPQLKKVAKGQDTDLNVATLTALVRDYRDHAAFEESEFLPLCHTILSRNNNHMAALGLSLHMRHVPPAVGYM